jgi:hypothetical protein
MPSVTPRRSIGDLLNTLTEALEAGGFELEPGSVDVTGLTVLLGSMPWRLRIDPESLLYPTQEQYESADRSGAFLGETDPCGFNGMETDVDF